VRRAVALAAAAAVVAAALFVRSRLDRRGEERSTTARLICSVELEQACQALRGADSRVLLTVEPAGVTADRVATALDDPGLDGWLVPEPWPDIVEARRRARSLPPLFATERTAVARSPLALVVWMDRQKALVDSGRCPGGAGWKCLGEAAGGPWTASGGNTEWGSPKLGLGDPLTDAVGLLVLGQAVASWFGRTDLSTIDLESDDFARWFSALGRAVPPSATSPLGLMLVAGRAQYDATGTVEAEAGPLKLTSARGGELDLLYPSPMATADVTLAAVGGAPSTVWRLAEAEELRQALTDGGWRVTGEGTIRGISTDPLPPTNGLPPAGLLDALRDRWRQVARR
jgi:hypothetical protein